jgi:hypothetical protein
MIEFNEACIRKLIFHRIADDRKSIINQNLYDIDAEVEEEILKKIFLKPFMACNATYEFKHTLDLELHALFKLSKSIFKASDFVSISQQIYHYLKSVSKHQNINDGDLFILKFDDVKFNNQLYNAIGIYKIEKKDNFLEVITEKNEDINLKLKEGISGRKLDKACLILETEEPYTILLIDNANTETDYWQNEFLSIELKSDNINTTNQFLQYTKSFIVEQFPTEFETTKADQIELLNRSVQFFKKNDTFDKSTFEEEVFVDKNIIQSFRNFDEVYKQDNEFEFQEQFEISAQAVKKQAKYFKSVLKLDKNFHIYIHGNTELIQQGIDDDGRKFYKIYYKEEN